jgi:hypothetical protein
MKKQANIIEGKNGLRNYGFEAVQKDKVTSHYDRDFGRWTETQRGMFYKKNCLYCSKEFEGKRVDAAFCCQSCQKAHLRLRKK